MKGKVYVITGAASGIGRAFLESVVQDADMIFAGYRSEAKADELKNFSDNIYPFYADYSKPETIKDAAEYIKSKCGKIDRLVNIAGCVVAGPIEKIDINEIRRQFDVNVFGHIEMTQRLIELLDGGRIINISSMASYGLFPFISPYCASKRCLDIFFNSLLIENKRNLQVVSIKPGVISTPLWEKSINENMKHLGSCDGYVKEMDYIMKNAKKNEATGLDVSKVVDVIKKADEAKNPKISYNVGMDSYMAQLVSTLPQSVLNRIIKLGMSIKKRLAK